ncbi:DUF7946 domain-containing protein [Limibacillus halophilus]
MKPLPHTSATVSYNGLYADDHIVDIRHLAKSLDGIGLLSNGILHFYLYGEVAKHPNSFRVRSYAGPPLATSLSYEIVALMTSSQLPLFAPFLLEVAETFLPRIWEAAIAKGSGNRRLMEKQLEFIQDQAKRYDEFANKVHEGHMQDKRWLQEHIDKITLLNRNGLQSLPAPVGDSCRTVSVWNNSDSPVVVDEPTATALRKPDEIQVGDTFNARLIIRALNLDSGAGKADLIGHENKRVDIKVTDPNIILPKNLYSGSLDKQTELKVVAKPTLRDGQMTRLFISDAESSE